MTVYALAQLRIHDAERYGRYMRRIMPVLEECRVDWLEEPFPSYDFASYREARSYGNVPLACGENGYSRSGMPW